MNGITLKINEIEHYMQEEIMGTLKSTTCRELEMNTKSGMKINANILVVKSA